MTVYVKVDEGIFDGEVYSPETVEQAKMKYLEEARTRIQTYINSKKGIPDYFDSLRELQKVLTYEPKDLVEFYLDWVDIRFIECTVK